MNYTEADLQRVQKKLKRNTGFPHDWCDDTAVYLQKRFGFYWLVGTFDGFSHGWDYDPDKRLYIDLTAFQFDPGLPEILICSPNSKTGRRYKREITHKTSE